MSALNDPRSRSGNYRWMIYLFGMYFRTVKTFYTECYQAPGTNNPDARKKNE